MRVRLLARLRRPNLHRRLAVALLAQTVVVLLVTALALFLVLRQFLEVGEAQRLERLVGQVSVHVASDKHDVLEFDHDFPDDVHVRLLHQGVVLAATPGFPPIPVDSSLGRSRSAQHQVLTRELREDGVRYTLQLAGDPTGTQLALRAYVMALAVIVPVAAVLVALLSNLLAANMLAPVARLERAAAAISSSRELRTPIQGVDATDELGRLANTLQAAFGRLADGMDREVAFLRAAAHDLRSPLTALKTRVEGVLANRRDASAYRAALVEIGLDVDGMVRLVNHLLMLANDGAPNDLRRLDLVSVAGEAVDSARAARPGVFLTTSFAPDTPEVAGDATLLAQLLGNLLDNAAHHGGGAPTHVSTWRSPEGGAVLCVSDEGPGIDEASLPRAAEPFFRTDSARTRAGRGGPTGSGLGLAIVKRIVEWHDARWELNSAPGSGLVVTVRFPAPLG
ncbi:MAG: HAMP domain-containing histidine kinase [Trueperaceae bacterium]|nr:HAMP domain-containing histidine kinase [Trueperaceae bacterium]